VIRPATFTDILLLILLAAIYGSAFTAIKIAVPELGPFGLVLARVLIGFAVLLPYALARGWVWPSRRSSWALLAFLCAFNLIIPFFLVTWAQQHINASLMALLMGAGPLFGLLMSHVATRDDKLSGPKLAGVAIGFLGVAVVLGIDAFTGLSGGNFEARLAQAAALVASACYAVSGVFVRRITDVPPHQLASLVLGFASLLLVLATPVLAPDIVMIVSGLSRDALIAMLYLGAVTTGGAYILRYTLIRTVGMSYFGLSIYLVPVFGVGIAAFWLSEPVPLSLLAGLALILMGLGVARLKRRGEAATEREAPIRE
jgi:drug/metabolite transporter (DMT)-like permease